MTRPNTGQPETYDELTNATQNANAEIGRMLESGEIERGFSDENETEMVVRERGETRTFTRDEWERRRDTRTRLWDRLERNGGMFVRVAHWFTDADVNAVKIGRGFYGEKIDETEKALQFACDANTENHTADLRTVWVPKKAVRTYELK